MLKNQKINSYENRGRLLTAVVLYFISVFFIFTSTVFAQIEITEIMYDLEGSDSGREWIEIYNSGTEDIDLSIWKLFEAEVNHRIKPVIDGDGTIISSGSYVILVDNYEKFEIDYPNFSGVVIDTSFSLKNTGELLTLRDSELVDINSVNYLPDWGANGNGNSLQKINGKWREGIPTPGEVNSQDFQPPEEDNSEDSSDPQGETSAPTTSPTVYKIEPQLFAKIIPPTDTPIAGADFFFEAEALGLQGEPLQNAEYQWTFGDGARIKGKKVLHNYQYPSNYLVVLEVISGKYSASDRLKIKVISSDIIISEIGVAVDNNFIELSNSSTYELNLSWWRLRVDNNYFAIPKNTILLPKSKIKFSSRTTKLFPKQNSLVNLLYPNGSVAFNYVKKVVVVKNKVIQNSPIVKNPQTSPVSQTQTTSIQATTQKTSLVSEPLGVEHPRVENVLLSSSSSQLQTPESKSDRNLFNKWTMLLAGIVSLAVAGVAFATKLDK